MKKKRGPKAKAGYKKGKQKGSLLVNDPASALGSINTENDMGLDENDEDFDSKIESESPTTLGDRIRNFVSIDADLPTKDLTQKWGPGHVKVKLKSSRPLEAQHTHSDLQSETDLSLSKVNLPGQMLNIENKEDSAYSDGLSSDLQTTSSKSPRKSGSIKIISSKGFDKYLNKKTSSVHMLGERGFIPSDNEKNVDSPTPPKVHEGETGSPYQDSCYNEKELNDSLAVIKKVMKMDAAEPFNVPVDPVALGIPDYFDVIDTPMDFGTICNNLEHGRKYLSSEDVFKDVQIIWDNCCKYNNKGDYIIDLMRRVKKNFTKYWLAADLYCEVPVVGALETVNAEEHMQSHQEKLYAKGKISKYKRRRPGTNHHKSGCLCAVCVVRRQKKEREGNVIVANLMAISDVDTFYEPTQEESFPIDNHDSEHSSMSLSLSPVHHSIVDAEEHEHGEMDDPEFHQRQLGRLGSEENEMEHHNINGISTLQPTLAEREMQDDIGRPSQGEDIYMDYKDGHEGYKHNVHDEAGIHEEKESVEKQEESSALLNQMELFEDPLCEENHSILQICGTIFSRDCGSVWNGPHSLTHQFGVFSAKANPFHAAISTLFQK